MGGHLPVASAAGQGRADAAAAAACAQKSTIWCPSEPERQEWKQWLPRWRRWWWWQLPRRRQWERGWKRWWTPLLWRRGPVSGADPHDQRLRQEGALQQRVTGQQMRRWNDRDE